MKRTRLNYDKGSPMKEDDTKTHSTTRKAWCPGLVILVVCSISYTQETVSKPNPHMGLEAWINQILKQMTVQEKIEQLYYKTDGNARLGIPQLTGSDGPHGIRGGEGPWSCFPVTLRSPQNPLKNWLLVTSSILIY